MFRALVAILALLVAIGAAGCQQAAEKATQKVVEQATGVQVSQKGDSVTVKGKDGEQVTVSSTELPAELKDFPVPQGFTLDKDSMGAIALTGSAQPGTTDKMATATWSGKSTLQAVGDFYRKAMTERGWTEDMAMDTGDGGVRSYTKGDTQTSITFSVENGIIKIGVLMSKTSGQQSASAQSRSTSTSASAGSGSASSPTAASSSASASAGTDQAPEPTATPAPPKTTDSASVPQELKSIPVPSGFAVKSGSALRMAAAGSFQAARVIWFGKKSIKDVAAFYANSIPKQEWTSDTESVSDESAEYIYTNVKNPDLTLQIIAVEVDAGTEIEMSMEQQ